MVGATLIRRVNHGALSALALVLFLTACSAGEEATPNGSGPTAVTVAGPAITVPDGLPSDLTIDPQLSLSAYEEVLVGIYQAVLPSVVHVQVHAGAQAASPLGTRAIPTAAEGSGFVWSGEGHIVTNHHVVDDADRVVVVFANGQELPAEVLGTDPDSDLAVLKVEPPGEGLIPVQQGNSDELRVGQLAFAVGSPFGQEFSMTGGIISALGRSLQAGSSSFGNPDIIQTDTPINPGNSGGPLIDRYANVIGINAQILTNSGSNSGVGFAIPINTAKRIIPVLIAEGDYTYAYMGISGTTVRNILAEIHGLPPDTRGVLVMRVLAGGPAAAAGLRPVQRTEEVDGITYPAGGDIITAIDGMPVRSMEELISHLVAHNGPGDEVTLEVLSPDAAARSVQLTLGRRPDVGAR